MNATSLVTSLPTSRLLKEVGIKQGKSYFVWVKPNPRAQNPVPYLIPRTEWMGDGSIVAAFLTDELLEMLPTPIRIFKGITGYLVDDTKRSALNNKSLPEALASLLLKVREK
jgi:hypothetical protein